MLETLLQAFVVIGFTIMASLYYLARQSKKIEQNVASLIRFNDENNYDALILVKKSWPYFKKAGFDGFKCELDWFGTKINYSFGISSKHQVNYQEKMEDISVVVTAYTSKHIGEKQYFDNIFWQSYVLLLKMNILMKLNTIFSTQHQLQKYNTFVLHDMKNIAQFVMTIDSQIKKQTNNDKLVGLLGAIVPSVKIRAERIIQTLTHKEVTKQQEVLTEVVLQDKIMKIAQMLGVNVQVSGVQSFKCNEEKIDQVIDNLLNNYLHHGDSNDNVDIMIKSNTEKVEVVFHSPQKVTSYSHKRLFEPFWSSTQHGMGIGMYQCQVLLKTMGGTLDAYHQKDNTLEFVIQFKK